MNTKTITLVAGAVLITAMAPAGCGKALKTCSDELKTCSKELKECRDHGGGTMPTCGDCTLTWSPGSSSVKGTVNGMVTTYDFAAIDTDPGLATEKQTRLTTLPQNGQRFDQQMVSSPPTKPANALMYLYFKSGGINYHHTTNPPFNIKP